MAPHDDAGRDLEPHDGGGGGISDDINNVPDEDFFDPLDKIERLQARVAELEQLLRDTLRWMTDASAPIQGDQLAVRIRAELEDEAWAALIQKVPTT